MMRPPRVRRRLTQRTPGGYDEDVEVEATYELTTLDAKEQETFSRWRFNHESPLSYDDADGDAPEFALLQAFGAMSDPKKMREFVAKAPDGVLLTLTAEVGWRLWGVGVDVKIDPLFFLT